MTNTIIPGVYRQHILAAVRIAGHQPFDITTHGGGPGAEGSYITATFAQQLMITMYDLDAATTYITGWTADDHQWIFEQLPVSITAEAVPVTVGPALTIRAHGGDHWATRFDSPSRTAIVRIGSLIWTIQDRPAANSMLDAWRHLADLAPVVLGRQAPIRHR